MMNTELRLATVLDEMRWGGAKMRRKGKHKYV